MAENGDKARESRETMKAKRLLYKEKQMSCENDPTETEEGTQTGDKSDLTKQNKAKQNKAKQNGS